VRCEDAEGHTLAKIDVTDFAREKRGMAELKNSKTRNRSIHCIKTPLERERNFVAQLWSRSCGEFRNSGTFTNKFPSLHKEARN